MACGTPVITLDTGSAKEAITHGKTGYLAKFFKENERKSIEEMVEYSLSISKIRNEECRRDAERRFDWNLCSERYLEFYREILEGKYEK